MPITTAESEPEPDLAVVRGPASRYARSHPGPEDVAFLVEVADTTLVRDRGFKGRIYARARVPIYWIVNLVDRQIEVYTGPSGPAEEPGFSSRRDYSLGEAVPVVLEGREIGRIAVKDLLVA
ncbi:MAG: Uma2 family endonuclease [Planctomycetes bacterium]|nr:Uma2 family endonuclease [Planctomycetota bacterium]